MPHSSCDPCCDPTGNSKGVDQYRSSVVQVLCASFNILVDILAAIAGGILPGATAAVWHYSNTAFGTITNTFTSVLTNSSNLKNIKFSNLTDQDMEISFDGTNVHDYVRAGEIELRDLTTNGTVVVTNIRIRYVTAPSTGKFIISAFS